VTGVSAEVGSTANNYQILARLATGGMAEIFLARGTSTTGVARYVVLKRILRDRANDVQLVRMFLDEARLAAQLQHANVAQVYDIGKLGDSYFFTMEYVHGETVRALLHRARSLRREVPNNVILTVMTGAAAGLHHAHERLGHDGRPLGIVHRDVSPSNLMVSYEGGVKVVDFGVAKAENRAQETRSGTVKGKIAYLSPEQCKGTAIDRRSDLFSLGIVFWEMLTVERLYKRNSDFENMTAIVTEPPIPPSARRQGIPPELDQIVLRLLSKEPDDRYQTADELVEALEDVAPKVGALISTSSVGRLLREMFGQRPEPWLEMDATLEMPQPPEGVTVTSEPIPKELESAPAHSMDNLLRHVRDLSQAQSRSATEAPIPVAGVPSQQMTAPALAAQAPRIPQVDPAEQVTVPVPVQPPLPPTATMHGYANVPPQRAQRASGPMPPLQPQVDPNFAPAGSSSGEHSYPNPFPSGQGSSSGAHRGFMTGSESAYPVISTAPQPHKQRGWPLIAIVLGAAVIGSLTVFLVMRGTSSKSTLADDASQLAAAPDDAPEPPDATAAAVEIDAAPVAVDAAAPVVVDAAPVAVDAAPVAVDAAPVAVDAPARKRSPLQIAMDERRYADVVHECGRSFSSETAATCTLAACRASQDSKAQRWYPRIPTASARRAMASTCREAGVDVTPPKVRPPPPPPKPDAGVVDPCAANPMACQR